MISFILAMDKNNLIGKDNKLPWHLPGDLKFFKSITLNKKIIMGRKTFESLPFILPNRHHIVLTTKGLIVDSPNVTVVSSIDEALLQLNQNEESIVIGGAQIFKEFMPYATKAYITKIEHEFEGDAYFDGLDNNWSLTGWDKGVKDDKNPYNYFFQYYERNK